jgi:peptidyl-prolyl cis-trans isomerase SurA
VALVDEDVILRSELDLAVAGIVERASGEAMLPMNLLESQVLERLIIRELQAAGAADRHPRQRRRHRSGPDHPGAAE